MNAAIEIQTLLTYLEFAPSDAGKLSTELAGWRTPSDNVVCPSCAGRILARGCTLPTGSKPIWLPAEPVRCALRSAHADAVVVPASDWLGRLGNLSLQAKSLGITEGTDDDGMMEIEARVREEAAAEGIDVLDGIAGYLRGVFEEVVALADEAAPDADEAADRAEAYGDRVG